MSETLKNGVCTKMFRYKFAPTTPCPVPDILFDYKEDVDTSLPKHCEYCKHYELAS